jgi:hypothetical protein
MEAEACMATRVINARGRIHAYGPRLEHAPEDVVHVGHVGHVVHRWTMGGWDLPRHPPSAVRTRARAGGLNPCPRRPHPGRRRLG